MYSAAAKSLTGLAITLIRITILTQRFPAAKIKLGADPQGEVESKRQKIVHGYPHFRPQHTLTHRLKIPRSL